ncbi:MAG: protein kinase [Deltaproteobacteria bacterium]|nr:protein kinase [Deltaproteobacteria bacterium]
MFTLEFLAGLQGFGSLEPGALARIAAGLETRTYAPGEYLLRRGEPGDHMHVIRAGQVRVPLLDAAGREKAVFLLGEGELVGEMALLTGEARTADVLAEVETTTLVLHRATLEPLLAEHPPLAAFLTEILGKRLLERGGIERVGKYRLLGLLGEGMTGKVYEALHPGLHRSVAVKMLSHALVYNGSFRERFLQEARTVAGLTHPNIVQVFDTEAAYGTYFIVMEKLAGRDLAALLAARGALPAHEAMAILRQVGAALAFAHARGFVHRDVKPANVWVGDDGGVKLMDFGLSRPIPRDVEGRSARGVEGTPQYLAPETAVGREPDGRADIYALGVMAFEMVTGRLPFQEDRVADLLRAHVRTPPPDVTALVPDLPAGLGAFIQGALAKKPSERLSDWERINGLLGGAESGAAGWANAEEWLLRVRCLPSASGRVRAALEALEADLGAAEGVDLARAQLRGN